MLAPGFHALGWDGPGLLFEIDFWPSGPERFAGAGCGQGRKLKRRRGDGSAFAGSAAKPARAYARATLRAKLGTPRPRRQVGRVLPIQAGARHAVPLRSSRNASDGMSLRPAARTERSLLSLISR